MMAYLSKNIFRLHAADKKISTTAINIYNSQVYHNPYAKERKMSLIPFKFFYSPTKGKNIEMIKENIEKRPYITLGHGSLLKADIFDDHEKFVPTSVQFMLRLYEKGAILINSQLIKKVLEIYNFPNNTQYYRAQKIEIEHFLNVNKGGYSFLTYS